jgi:hypothetical protein
VNVVDIVMFGGLFGAMVAILVLSASLERWLRVPEDSRPKESFERPLVRVVRTSSGKVTSPAMPTVDTRSRGATPLRTEARGSPKALKSA